MASNPVNDRNAPICDPWDVLWYACQVSITPMTRHRRLAAQKVIRHLLTGEPVRIRVHNLRYPVLPPR